MKYTNLIGEIFDLDGCKFTTLDGGRESIVSGWKTTIIDDHTYYNDTEGIMFGKGYFITIEELERLNKISSKYLNKLIYEIY